MRRKNVAFPRKQFRISVIVNRSLQATWFDRCKWLHNDAGNDSAIAFCFVCCKAVEDRKVRAGFCEMQKKVFYLINLVIVYKGICRIQLLLLKPLCKDFCNELATISLFTTQ